MAVGGDDVVVRIGGTTVTLQQAINDAISGLARLQTATNNTSSSANQANKNLAAMRQELGDTTEAGTKFGNALKDASSSMLGFINNALQIATGVGLYDFFDTVLEKAKEFGDEMFELNKQMERAVFGWQYTIYGKESPAQRSIDANALAEWTKQESYNIPFTRQDMVQAITTLGAAGLTADQVKQYIPMIADLAATQGAANNVSMWQAAYDIKDAMYGRTVPLRYNLAINPDELAQYGFDDSSDTSRQTSLIPALQKYMAARGEIGAAKDIAHETFYGAWSSFLDRIQNFQIDTGGKGFLQLKDILNDITSWWDAHQNDINLMADTLGGALAQGVIDLGKAAKQFFEGWQGSGAQGIFGGLGELAHGGLNDFANAVKGLSESLTNNPGIENFSNSFEKLAHVLADPHLAAFAEIIGQIAGDRIGAELNWLSGIIDLLRKTWENFAKSDLGKDSLKVLARAVFDLQEAWKQLVAAVPPGVMDQIVKLMAELGGAAIFGGILLLVDALELLSGALRVLAAGITGIRGLWDWLMHGFEDLTLKAYVWGFDLMHNLGAGIQDAWAAVTSPITDLTNYIKAMLGHSVPSDGPLADELNWMPHMMQNLAAGIDESLPMIAAASQRAASTIAAPFQGAVAGASSSSWSTSYGDTYYTTTLNAVSEAQATRIYQKMRQTDDEQQNNLRRQPGPLAVGLI